jgi:hypothetical protein
MPTVTRKKCLGLEYFKSKKSGTFLKQDASFSEFLVFVGILNDMDVFEEKNISYSS